MFGIVPLLIAVFAIVTIVVISELKEEIKEDIAFIRKFFKKRSVRP